MTHIIRLSDNEGDQRPVMARAYALRDSNDDLVAIEKFVVRYNRVPDEVWVWRGTMYIPVMEGEK
jgi:hypothetical protein